MKSQQQGVSVFPNIDFVYYYANEVSLSGYRLHLYLYIFTCLFISFIQIPCKRNLDLDSERLRYSGFLEP